MAYIQADGHGTDGHIERSFVQAFIQYGLYTDYIQQPVIYSRVVTIVYLILVLLLYFVGTVL